MPVKAAHPRHPPESMAVKHSSDQIYLYETKHDKKVYDDIQGAHIRYSVIAYTMNASEVPTRNGSHCRSCGGRRRC